MHILKQEVEQANVTHIYLCNWSTVNTRAKYGSNPITVKSAKLAQALPRLTLAHRRLVTVLKILIMCLIKISEHTHQTFPAFFFLFLRLNIPVMLRCIIELVFWVGVEASEFGLCVQSDAPSSGAVGGGGGKLAMSASSNSTCSKISSVLISSQPCHVYTVQKKAVIGTKLNNTTLIFDEIRLM